MRRFRNWAQAAQAATAALLGAATKRPPMSAMAKEAAQLFREARHDPGKTPAFLDFIRDRSIRLQHQHLDGGSTIESHITFGDGTAGILTTFSQGPDGQEMRYMPSGRLNRLQAARHGLAAISEVRRAQESMTMSPFDRGRMETDSGPPPPPACGGRRPSGHLAQLEGPQPQAHDAPR